MNQWRPVQFKFWTDEKVRQLSRGRPNGRELFLYLLTAVESHRSLPGVVLGWDVSIAKSLGWPVEGMLKIFRDELEKTGIARADWSQGLIWLPNALRYTSANANQRLGFVRAVAGLPDCSLKKAIQTAFERFQKGELDSGSSLEGLSNGSGTLPEALPIEEEGEEEQEGEQEGEPSGRDASLSLQAQEVFDHWRQRMNKRGTVKFDDTRKRKVIGRLRDGYTVTDLKRAIDGCASLPWNMGLDPKTNGKTHNDLELICRDSKHVEQYRDAISGTPEEAPPTVDDFGRPLTQGGA